MPGVHETLGSAGVPAAANDTRMPTHHGRVGVVVVTYNRKVLLVEALTAIFNQSAPIASVLVIDNASTDGTGEALAAAGFTARRGFEHVVLSRNGGGAGGFHEGIARAANCEWIWVMDDDTIPAPDALQQLIGTWAQFPADRRPVLLGSRVNWTDGSLHAANAPSLRWMGADSETAMLAAEYRTVPIRTATFVSLLIDSRVVAQHGLPHRDYFIWNDDVEYTARILRNAFGVIVPRSVVVHKTAKAQGVLHAEPERYYFQVRNVLWMITRSDAWALRERAKIFVNLVRWTIVYLYQRSFSANALGAVARAVADAIFTAPRA